MLMFGFSEVRLEFFFLLFCTVVAESLNVLCLKSGNTVRPYKVSFSNLFLFSTKLWWFSDTRTLTVYVAGLVHFMIHNTQIQ